MNIQRGFGGVAVLWLVLVVGETLKWAQLNDHQMNMFSILLLLLMVGMAVLCFFLILKRSPTVGKATKARPSVRELRSKGATGVLVTLLHPSHPLPVEGSVRVSGWTTTAPTSDVLLGVSTLCWDGTTSLGLSWVERLLA